MLLSNGSPSSSCQFISTHDCLPFFFNLWICSCLCIIVHLLLVLTYGYYFWFVSSSQVLVTKDYPVPYMSSMCVCLSCYDWFRYELFFLLQSFNHFLIEGDWIILNRSLNLALTYFWLIMLLSIEFREKTGFSFCCLLVRQTLTTWLVRRLWPSSSVANNYSDVFVTHGVNGVEALTVLEITWIFLYVYTARYYTL